ncbi:PE domain-containing protein [Mycolicibacterium flavescens]|uniref:PE domain-containing protein n=1 Tax=Mycolicibacterium flavescens TaxID=1776 RepID=A0A1E3RNR5_MYCFV|nr:PE domain-containing protein [Mycolicibacterium flavescens]MCV7278227.1 PE domain-containing protein [Mycolicibacterium flavescens]ODQ91489.1 hypothetical protein BHQ18_05195 [Mycolicibacterium flavescens]
MSGDAGVVRHLEVIAERIDALLARERADLEVSAAGDDEISRRVAKSLNRMAEEFSRSVNRGAAEIRGMAQALRPEERCEP